MIERITRPEIAVYLGRCRGKKISRVWKGHGSALFLELGRLHSMVSPKGKKLGAHGEITIQVVWEWRIEKYASILVGSANTAQRILNQIPKLKGRHVQEIAVSGRLPELNLALSGDLWITTCTHWQGQPEWVIQYYEDETSMFVRRGGVCVEKDRGGWPTTT